ncbi:MAG TPA: hypothetical protein GX521_00305 [Firmicutes bacterium]|nr:hypothetical protein [Bacillota bacterium]
MPTDIAAVTTSLKRYHLRLEVSARLATTAKAAVEVQSEAVLKLLESAQILLDDPNLGTLIDVKM